MSAAVAPSAPLPALPRDVVLLIVAHLTPAERLPFRFIKTLRSSSLVLSPMRRPQISGLITTHTTRSFLLWAMRNLRIDAPAAQPLVCQALARHGHLELLQYVRSLSPPFTWGEATATAAAVGGHLDTLKWLHANGLPCTATAREQGARLDYLDAFIWGLRNDDIPTPNEYDLWLAAVRSPTVLAWLLARRKATRAIVRRAGSVACLDLLWKHAPDIVQQEAAGCLETALRRKDTELRRWIFATLPPDRVQSAVTSLVSYISVWWGATVLADFEAHGMRLDFTGVVCQTAKDLDTVKYLRARGVPWGNDYYVYASNRSQGLERVVWAYENGCPLTATVLQEVVVEGTREAWNYLRSKFQDSS